MAKITRKEVIKHGNVTTVYRNVGTTPTTKIKGVAPVTVKKNPKTIGNVITLGK